jgi:hypothetical protein
VLFMPEGLVPGSARLLRRGWGALRHEERPLEGRP